MQTTKLSDQHEQFCQRYVIHWKGKQAAIEVGIEPKAAKNQATTWLQNPLIQSRITELRKEAADRNKLDQDFVLAKLQNWADSNISDFFDINEAGQVILKDLETLPRELTSQIQKITQTKYGITIELVDKRGSTIDIGRYLGMFVNSNEVGEGTLEQALLKKKRLLTMAQEQAKKGASEHEKN